MKLYILLLVVCISAFARGSASEQLRFKRLTTADGLSNNTVWGITQDRFGFMWIATFDGLNRYDGNTFKVYRHIDNDSTSLPGSSLRGVMNDSKGNLWVITWSDGLARYDYERDCFIRYRHDPNDSNSLSSDLVRSISEDNEGNLWLGTMDGLTRLNPETGTFKRYFHNPNDTNSLISNHVPGVTVDSEGLVWIGSSVGLCNYNPKTDTYTRFESVQNVPGKFAGVNIFGIHEEDSNTIWIGHYKGASRYDKKEGAFTNFLYSQGNPSGIGHSQVLNTFTDSKGGVWLSTFGGGLDRFNPEDETFTHYTHNPVDESSIGNNTLWTICEDKHGVLWISTVGGGITLLFPGSNTIAHHRNVPGDTNTLFSNVVRALEIDKDGKVWIGNHDVVSIFDTDQGTMTHFGDSKTDPITSAANIWGITRSRDGDMWVATFNDGFYHYSYGTGEVRHYRNDPRDSTSLSNNTLTNIVEDKNGTIWVATWVGGLNAFDRKTRSFKRYGPNPNDSGALSHFQVTSLLVDREEQLWIGTNSGGVNRYDYETDSFVKYRHREKDPTSLSSDAVWSLGEDSRGNIWAGTLGAGVNKLNKKTGEVTRYRVQDGLCDNSVNGIIEENGKNGELPEHIWFTTANGVSRLNLNSGAIVNYDKHDGFQSNEFTPFDAVCKTETGVFVLGGANGINIFHPDSIVANKLIPPVHITGFTFTGEDIPISDSSVLNSSILMTDSVTLSYLDRIFTIRFASLNYKASLKNRFRYKLEGFDSEWHEVGSDRPFATYTNLDAGRYRFRVLGSNNDGLWNEIGDYLVITITPPWWETILFRFSVFMAIVIFITGAFYRQKKNAEIRARKLEDEVAARTLDLKDANEIITREKDISDSLIDSLPGLFYLIDKDSKYLRVNRNHLSLLGYSPEELIGKCALDYIAPDDLNLVKSTIVKVFENGKASVESRLKTKDGRMIPFLLFGSNVEIDGEPHIVGSGFDLTDLKRAEAEIRKLSSVVEQSPNLILITDLDGVIEYANPAFTAVSGYTMDEAVGKTPRIIRSENTKDALYKDLWRTIKAGNVWRGEILNKRKDGSFWWALLAVSPVKDSQGELKYYVGIQEDISQRKQLETDLVDAKGRAEESAKSKSFFLANMSHEIRTPMNSIIGFIELAMEMDSIPDRTIDYLNTARGSAKGLLSLINDILDVSKLEAGKMEIENHIFNLPRFLNTTLQPLTLVCREKALELSLEIPAELNIAIEGDSNRLRQIILNLVGNSLKFTEKGSITLIVEEAADDILKFAVKDTGIGMTEEQVQKVFESFTQADQSTARRYGGTGLGTTICKQLVTLMGGEIWIESELGVGTTFNFTLPKVVPTQAEIDDMGTIEYEDALMPEATRSLNILLAEDIQENATLAIIRLNQQGHNVEWAKDGREVVEMYQEGEYDLILMDIHMPVMDGLEATRKIRELEEGTEEHIVIIALTASLMEEDKDQCLVAGMDDVVGKPVQFEELFQKIEKIVPEDAGEKIENVEIKPAVPENWILPDSIEGVDIKKGLDTWHNRSAYAEALANFREKYVDAAEELKTLLENEKFEEAYFLTHSLKGVAGNLSIYKVEEMAINVDSALMKHAPDETFRWLPKLEDALKASCESIQEVQYIGEGAGVSAGSEDIDIDALKILESELESLFHRGEFDDELLNKFVSLVRGHVDRKYLEELRKWVENFDFTGAEKSLQFIMNSLL